MADGTEEITRMDPGSLGTMSQRHEWERGWKVVAVALVTYVFGSAGMFFAIGLFLKPLSSEFHWSRGAISGSTSIASVVFALSSPVVGCLADRFGEKRAILICAVLYGVSFGSQCLLTRHLWHYYAIAFLTGLAASGTSALTFGKVISNWFDRSRGLALSALACGSGLGGAVIPPFAQSLISHYGWREAYLLLGLSMLTVGTIPVVLILNSAPPTKTTNITSSAGKTSPVARVPRSQVLRSYTFLTLIAVVAIVGISYGGVMTNLIPMMTDRGMTAAAAASLVSLLGVSAIAGHLLIGFCFDRFPATRVAALTLALSGMGIGMIAVAQSRTLLALATILLGAALGADTDVLPYLVSRYFTLESYGEFLGYFFATGTFGWLEGRLSWGGYLMFIILMSS